MPEGDGSITPLFKIGYSGSPHHLTPVGSPRRAWSILARRSSASLTLLLATTVIGQTPTQENQDHLLARRAAEADCFRRLAETIQGLQINSQTHVRDFVTESDSIQSDLDAFIAGVALGPPEYLPDGTCTVWAHVGVDEVISRLRDAHARSYQGDAVTAPDFDQMRRTIGAEVLDVAGHGAPRSDVPPGLPQGVAARLVSVPAGLPVAMPSVWQRIPPNERLMAQRAAELDAKRRLVERILGLRVNSKTVVRDFLTESDQITTESAGFLVGARQSGPAYFHADAPMVEVTVEVPVESVTTAVNRLNRQYFDGRRVLETDMVRLQQDIRRTTFEATGSGVARLPVVREWSAETGQTIPEWIATRIVATGSGTDPEMHMPQGKLRAVRAAESDARRRLAEQVFGLAIEPSVHVGDVVGPQMELRAQIDAVIVGSVVDKTEFTAQGAEVTISIPGGDVWSVVNPQLHRPPPDSASPPAP